MKKFAQTSALVIAMGVALLASSGAHALTAVGNFDVNITLTPKCEVTSTAALVFAYESFQTGAQAATGGGFSLRCTTGMVPSSFALDATSVTDNVTNLSYSITLPAPIAGTGSAQPYAVTGSMIAGQAGTCSVTAGCNNSTATNKNRTLTITY